MLVTWALILCSDVCNIFLSDGELQVTLESASLLSLKVAGGMPGLYGVHLDTLFRLGLKVSKLLQQSADRRS